MKETGTVKWFSVEKGFGFIARRGESDLFLHVKSLADGYRPVEGDEVSFVVVTDQKGVRAAGVTASAGGGMKKTLALLCVLMCSIAPGQDTKPDTQNRYIAEKETSLSGAAEKVTVQVPTTGIGSPGGASPRRVPGRSRRAGLPALSWF